MHVHPFIPVLCAAFGTALGAASLPAAARAGSVRERLPFDRQYTVPCAAAGAGEVVDVSGEISIVLRTSPGAGGTHYRGHWNAAFTGVGQTTGDTYHGTWTQNITSNGSPRNVQSVYTEQYSLRLVSANRQNNFVVTGNLRFVFDANGTLRVGAEGGRVECK